MGARMSLCCSGVWPIYTQGTSATKIFELKECISSGNTSSSTSNNNNSSSGGAVYVGLHRHTGQYVAIKVLKKSVISPKLYRRIQREVNILSKLHHPHIVRLYGIYESSNTIEIALELLHGGPVALRSQRHSNNVSSSCGLVSEFEISRVCSQVLSAIAHIHSKRILHGGIRPEHILYETLDATSRVILVDFGKADSNSHSKRRFLRRHFSKMNLVDVHFSPPCVLRNAATSGKPLSLNQVRQVDIWAFGVTLFTFLFGDFPFTGASNEELSQHILSSTALYFPPEIEPLVSLAAKDLLHRIFIPESEQSPTAEALLEHPWLKSGGSAEEFSSQHVAKLLEFTQSYENRRRRHSSSVREIVSSPVTAAVLPPRIDSNDEEEEEQSISGENAACTTDSGICLKLDSSSPGGYMRQADEDLSEFMSEVARKNSKDFTEPPRLLLDDDDR